MSVVGTICFSSIVRRAMVIRDEFCSITYCLIILCPRAINKGCEIIYCCMALKSSRIIFLTVSTWWW